MAITFDQSFQTRMGVCGYCHLEMLVEYRNQKYHDDCRPLAAAEKKRRNKLAAKVAKAKLPPVSKKRLGPQLSRLRLK